MENTLHRATDNALIYVIWDWEKKKKNDNYQKRKMTMLWKDKSLKITMTKKEHLNNKIKKASGKIVNLLKVMQRCYT